MSFLNGPARGRSVRMGAVLLAAVGTAGVLACAEPESERPRAPGAAPPIFSGNGVLVAAMCAESH